MSEALIKAAGWALALDERRRPQSVQEWRGALLGQAPVPPAASASIHAAPSEATTVRLPTTAADVAAHASTRERALPGRPRLPEPGRSPWRWVAAVFLVVVAVVAAREWSRQRDVDRARQEAARVAVERDAAERRKAEQRRLEEARLRRQEQRAAGVAEPAESPRERPLEREPRPGEDEMEKLKRRAEADFRSADANADGFLGPEEVRNRFPFLAKEFQRVDSDGDGRISLHEFMRFRQWQMQQRPAKQR